MNYELRKGMAMSVKVHLLKRVAGPDGNFPSGRTIEVSEAQAKDLVADGAAERIDAMVPYVQLTIDNGQLTTEEKAPKTKREMAVDKGALKREKATEG
jgi:hypothetical protein